MAKLLTWDLKIKRWCFSKTSKTFHHCLTKKRNSQVSSSWHGRHTFHLHFHHRRRFWTGLIPQIRFVDRSAWLALIWVVLGATLDFYSASFALFGHRIDCRYSGVTTLPQIHLLCTGPDQHATLSHFNLSLVTKLLFFLRRDKMGTGWKWDFAFFSLMSV